jgi:hypothetical protein
VRTFSFASMNGGDEHHGNNESSGHRCGDD